MLRAMPYIFNAPYLALAQASISYQLSGNFAQGHKFGAIPIWPFDTRAWIWSCDDIQQNKNVKYLKYPRSSSPGVLLAQLHFERRHPLLPVWVANEKNTIKPPGRAADICFPCQPRSCTAGCLFKPSPPYYSWKGLERGLEGTWKGLGRAEREWTGPF